MKSLKKYSPFKVAFGQSALLLSYIVFIAHVLWGGEKLFGPVKNAWGPVLVLSLFSSSALVCAFLSLAYPIWTFWEEKNTKRALTIVFDQILLMFLFTCSVLLSLILGSA